MIEVVITMLEKNKRFKVEITYEDGKTITKEMYIGKEYSNLLKEVIHKLEINEFGFRFGSDFISFYKKGKETE